MGRCGIAHACIITTCLLTVSVGIAQDLIQVTGTILDESGKPVEAAIVAEQWTASAMAQNPQGPMRPISEVRSGPDGRFIKEIEFDGRPVVLFAIDANQKHGGITVVEQKAASDPISIKLTLLVEVRGRFSCDDLKQAPTWTNVYIEHKSSGRRILSCDSRAAAFAFKLPPGEYDFEGYGSDVIGLDKVVTLSASKPSLDMGTVDLRATEIAMHKGKEPPAWNITDARGVSKSVTYADFKGKWVLIEFWGFW